MTFRVALKSNIVERADDDLKTLLFVDKPKVEDFNYSPLILRSVAEYLLKNGLSIGLGEINKKEIIDKYWKDVKAIFKVDIHFRVVIGTETYPYLFLFIFLRNHEIRRQIEGTLNNIPSLKQRNPLTYVTVNTLEDTKIYDILEQCRMISEEKKLTFETEEMKIVENVTSNDNFRIHYFLPEKFSFECQRCNFCELPSNTSVNPIANKPEGNIESISFNYRICFPCNLATLTYYEMRRIASKIGKSTTFFTQPLLLIKNKNTSEEDLLIGLKQNKGICIFQDLKKHKCKIQHFKPFNCFTYPLLVTFNNEDITVECDFACPGIGKGKKIDLESFSNMIIKHQQKKLKQSLLSPNKSLLDFVKQNWDIEHRYYLDNVRVTEEDIQIAKKALFLEEKSKVDY